MKRRSKIYIGIGISLIVALGICYQYYRINSGVPREYNIQKYSMGEVVKLDDFEVIVNNFTVAENKEYIDAKENGNPDKLYTVDFTIKNISNEDKPIKLFIAKSSILCGLKVVEIPLEIRSEDIMSSLKSQEKKDIRLTYEGYETDEDAVFEFYPSKELYRNEIKKDLENLKMHEKYVVLNLKK